MTSETCIVVHADEPLFDALENPTGDVLLASPYLSYPVCQRLAKLASHPGVAWRLLTRRDPVAVRNGYLSVQGLRSLIDAGVTLQWVPGLHAKAFVAGETFGLIGSGNLTESGLGTAEQPNAELGVLLDRDGIKATRSTMLSWDATTATPADLDRLAEEAQAYAKTPRPRPQSTEAVDLGVDRLLSDARDGSRTLWVKAEYGLTDLDAWRSDSWFASPSEKRRPHFRPGDLALMYAQKARAVYAVVEIVDEPVHDPDSRIAQGVPRDEATRWPWVSRTRPRLVPDHLVTVSLAEIGVKSGGLQNGHSRISLAGFATAVRRLQESSSPGSESD